MGARPPPHVAGVSLMNNRSGNKYGSLHSASPSKHDQVVDGAVRKVNTYQEGDRELIEEAINNFAYQHCGVRV